MTTVTRQTSVAPSAELTAAFRREAGSLLGFFLRRDVTAHDAADLVSETFLAAWRGSTRREIEPEMLRPWLFGIARKVLSQHRRGRIRRTALADRVRSTLPTGDHAEPDGAPAGDERDLAEHVRELIRNLPELDQEIVRLVYWEGFTQEEVATIVGKSAVAVRARLSRARGVLRTLLQESADVD